MSLDTPTVLYIVVLAYLAFGLVHVCLLRVWRDDVHFASWTAFNFLSSAGGVAVAMRDVAPTILSPIGAGLLLGGQGMLWAGLRQFNSQPVRWVAVWLSALLLTIVLLLYPPFAQNVGGRVGLYATATAAFGAFCLLDAGIAQRSEKLMTRWLVAGAIGASVVFALARIWSSLHDAVPVASLTGNSALQPSATVISLVLVFCLNLALLLMVHERVARRLLGQAHTDALTGVLNRSGFATLSERQIGRSMHDQQPASLLLLDLDHFKRVNDQHGHPVGDRLLCALVEAARRVVRPGDLIARHGGEEFCILLPNANLGEALVVANRLRERFASVRLRSSRRTVRATVSIGVAELALPDETVEQALERADKALYQAKADGRNRVVPSDDHSMLRLEHSLR